MTTETPKRRWRIGRRGFLIGAGATAGALALGYAVGKPFLHLQVAGMLDGGAQPATFSEDPWVWFEVLPDSRIRLFLGKIEMGQGVHTSIAQIAAEELGVALDDLEVVQATTSFGPSDSGTTGSSSISSVFAPLRLMAATLQEMLRLEAGRVLGLPAASLLIDGRAFVDPAEPARRADFGVLVSEHVGEWEIPEVELPARRAWRVIGQPLPRVDIPAKVTGRAVYGFDVRVEGMAHGAVLRPPTIAATLVSVDGRAAQAMPGVLAVVTEPGFAGVVAQTRAQAYAAVAALEAVWDEGPLWTQAQIEEIVTAAGDDGIVIQREGRAARLLAEETTLAAEYRTPFAIQTPLETQAAVAEVVPGVGADDRGLRIHVSTQMHWSVRGEVAELTGVAEGEIEVIPTYVGGGFGRKSGFESATEAARLALAAGVPVKVAWTRTEELRNGYLRPPTHHRLAARLREGRIEALEHQQASGDVAFGFLPGFLTFVMGADFGATRAARLHYGGIPHRHTVAYRRPLPVRTGWWRGLGLLANGFAVESFIDELAHAAGADPLQFRLDHLGDDADGARMAAVLRRVGELAGWGTPAPEGRARGVACVRDGGTLVAEVAEVSLDRTTGVVRVHQVWAAMDCGLTINPDGAAAQVEGNVMWGVGSALIEEMRVTDGTIPPANFDAYPLLTMKEAPRVTVALLEGGETPSGVGEPPIAPVAAAIGNALFALTGVRLRTLPFTPERVRAALASL